MRQLLMDQRLAAGDGNHRRTALVHRVQGVLDAHALVQDFLRVVDLAATGTRQIALEQWLQHHRQRIALLAAELLAENVARDRGLLDKWNAQWTLRNISKPRANESSCKPLGSTRSVGVEQHCVIENISHLLRLSYFHAELTGCGANTCECSRRKRSHSILNQGVKVSGRAAISASSAFGEI